MMTIDLILLGMTVLSVSALIAVFIGLVIEAGRDDDE